MRYRGAILLVAMLILVIPVAGAPEGCTTDGNEETKTVPVLYITGKDEYTFMFPDGAPDGSVLRGAGGYIPEGQDGDIVVLNATVCGTSVTFDESKVYASIREENTCFGGTGVSSGTMAQPSLTESIQGILGKPRLCALLNLPGYYLVNLIAEPVFEPNTLPENNFVSPEPKDRYFRLVVPEGKEHLWVDLNWAAEDAAGYRLTVYAPDAVMGPFVDADDGRTDDRIYLDIAGLPYLKEGMWHYLVTNLNGGSSNFNFTNYY